MPKRHCPASRRSSPTPTKVKASDEDIRWLDPNSSPEDLAARWLTLGPAIIAVTFGAHGSYAICAHGAERIPAYPAEVVDTVRAGDSFMTGLIDALGPRAIGRRTDWSNTESSSFLQLV